MCTSFHRSRIIRKRYSPTYTFSEGYVEIKELPAEMWFHGDCALLPRQHMVIVSYLYLLRGTMCSPPKVTAAVSPLFPNIQTTADSLAFKRKPMHDISTWQMSRRACMYDLAVLCHDHQVVYERQAG